MKATIAATLAVVCLAACGPPSVQPSGGHVFPQEQAISTFYGKRVNAVLARHYAQWTMQYGIQERVPPVLIAALMMQESAINRRAIGKHGEKGLMQVNPHFWDGMYPECGADVMNPKTNICYGVKIFKYFLFKNDGNFHKAVSEYNGVPNNKAYVQSVYIYLGEITLMEYYHD